MLVPIPRLPVYTAHGAACCVRVPHVSACKQQALTDGLVCPHELLWTHC